MKRLFLTLLMTCGLTLSLHGQTTWPAAYKFMVRDNIGRLTALPLDSLLISFGWPDSLARVFARGDSVAGDTAAVLRALIAALADTGAVNDTTRTLQGLIATKVDTGRITTDSLYFTGIITATAGDTTSPGLIYAPDSTTGKWVRADTSIAVRAVAFAIDSVLPDASCRFKLWGIYSLARWSWTPGKALFSDSATAGEIGYGGQAVPKKMQLIGVALDSVTVRCYFDPTITH